MQCQHLECDIPIGSFAASLILAYHDGRHGGGSGGLGTLLVFLGAIATATWLIFSQLAWRNTVMVTVAGWAVIIGLIWRF